MAYVRKKGSKKRYRVVDRQCIGAKCFSPGTYRIMSPGSAGLRTTGDEHLICMRNAYRGCPVDAEYDPKLAAERRRDGWIVCW